MIEHSLSVPLPAPWANQTFQTDHIGEINFLVGPNGSGKSQFARVLANQLNARLLSTDRLSGMEQIRPFQSIMGDHFAQGLAKDEFQYLREAGTQGSGIDTLVLLDERIDLRIQVEATLSHLFGREITLDWDSGRLKANVRRLGGSGSYRLDREECHGIKELIVLLTHLYDPKSQYLIIDEPELNLHPQYQAFFMQETRKIAGEPNIDTKKKVVFLITHSPFVLDLRSADDLRSVISFDLQCSVPKQVGNLDVDFSSISSLIPRLNAHHKQLFFSDNPIFVEGIHDAWLVEAMMEARGVSIAGAGSCVIDAGGVEQVNSYLKLCKGLGKRAHFLYDLDSLFSGRLRAHIQSEESIKTHLVGAGHGIGLDSYCGELEGRLTDLIDDILAKPTHVFLQPLVAFLQSFGPKRSEWKKVNLPKARTAVVTALDRHRDQIMETGSGDLVPSEQAMQDIHARLEQIVCALSTANVHLLPGGTIERYLPSYAGDHYRLSEDAKQQAINEELVQLRGVKTNSELSGRYGDLYTVMCRLPAASDVDVDSVLRDYLGKYIYDVQTAIRENPTWHLDQLRDHLVVVQKAAADVFGIASLNRLEGDRFAATIEVAEMLGRGKRLVRISNDTNAGMGYFELEATEAVAEAIS